MRSDKGGSVLDSLVAVMAGVALRRGRAGPSRGALAALVLAAAAAPAWAQEYELAVGVDPAYDDNIMRLPSNVSPSQVGAGDRSRGSAIYRGYFSANAKVPVGRQEFELNLVGNAFKFSEYSYLDYNALNGSFAWRWQAGERWSGLAYYEHVKTIAPFIDFTPVVRNLRTYDMARVTAEYWLHPSWRPYVGASWTDATSSYEPAQPGDVRVYAGELGVKYQAAGDNNIRGVFTYSSGEYPNRIVGDPFGTEYSQYDVGVDMLWNFTDRSSLYGRVAYTDRQYSDASGRDFSGPTGNVVFNWGVTGKTAIRFDLRREIGLWEDLAGRYYVTTVAGITPVWDISAALRLEASYEHWWRSYPNEGVTTLPEREDNLDFARVVLRWTPTRNWLLRVGYQWSQRDSNFPLADFRDNLYFATVQFAFNL